jgi:hypothetical protein
VTGRPTEEAELGAAVRRLLDARAGVTDLIQRSIIGERLLGPPR